MERTLQKLIALRTATSEKAENKKLLDRVAAELRPFLFVRRFMHRGFHSLIATTRHTRSPVLWLVAHSDVLPAPERAFRLERRRGNFYGRGVLDMKGMLACYLRLVRELGRDAVKYDFGIMITSDEEVGGWDGVKFLLGKGYRSRIAFVPDGGLNWHIEKGAKGVFHLKIKARGKASHASRPWEGVDAIIALSDFLRDLKRLFPREPCGRPGHFHDTLTVGKIEGGEAINQVSPLANAWIDIRYTPNHKEKEKHIRARLKKIARRHRAIRIKEVIHAGASENMINSPLIMRFLEIARNRFKIRIKPTFSHGSSDARFFTAKGIPALVIWPHGGGHHADTERVDIKSLELYYRLMKEWALEVTKVSDN